MTRLRFLILIALLAVAALAGGAALASDAPAAQPAGVAASAASARAAAAPDGGPETFPETSQADSPGDQQSSEDSDDAVEGPDVPITGSDLDRATEAALAFTGEGHVTDTEVGDEESYYEVEITLGDGRQIDVQLDEAFNVVGPTDY